MIFRAMTSRLMERRFKIECLPLNGNVRRWGEGWGFTRTKQTYLVLYVNVELEADWELA